MVELLERGLPTRRGWLAIVAGLGATLTILAAWGFSVDDALISGRVAHHLRAGIGYRFNPHGPVTDAVTPLGWAHALAPFAAGGAWSAVEFARWTGALLCIVAAAQHGARVSEIATSWRAVAAALGWAACFPLAAWASAGMETACVIALATVGTSRSGWGALGRGLAAAWRPELVPWAVTLELAHTWLPGNGEPHAVVAGSVTARRAALCFAPVICVMLVRLVAFGTPAPLALHAKPSDEMHGLRYALGALEFCVAPMLVLAPMTWRKLGAPGRAVLLASGVHFATLVFAGGDWMPLFRLATPVLPGLLLVGAELMERGNPWANRVRLGVAFGLSLVLWVSHRHDSAGVIDARRRLSSGLVALAEAPRVIGTVDVGWVGASGEAEVVDFAGVTDPLVAMLPGGHTSKALSRDFLLRRHIDTLVLLLAPGEHQRLLESEGAALPASDLVFQRQVEARVAAMDGFSAFQIRGTLPLAGTDQHYLVLQLPLGQGVALDSARDR